MIRWIITAVLLVFLIQVSGGQVITGRTNAGSFKPDPYKIDTDGDGLSDGDEVGEYHTDPMKVDTEGDGLSDGEEVKTHNTDPTKPDTDGDGLTDWEEVYTHHTSPLKSDTDNGGITDGGEVKRGMDPLDPKDDVLKEIIVLEKGKTVVLKGVHFASGKATLTRDSEETLGKAFDALEADWDVDVLIVGHTDNVGRTQYNKNLSVRRAESVKRWLVTKGIAASRLTVAGKGMDEPIDDNRTAKGRAANRRIEFRVLE